MTVIKQRSSRSLAPSIISIEMWERFSFYGMQAILAYYLYSTIADGGLGMDKTHATALLGAYGSLLYLFTFVGGWIADRLVGAERTLFSGACLLIFGHLCLSFGPGYFGLVAGLLPIAMGSGLLKTAAITILGASFEPDSDARDASFQIFYWGINVGGFCGPLLTGWLAQRYNYHVGFMAAAMLMAIGLIGYTIGRTYFLPRVSVELKQLISTPTHPLDKRGRIRTAALSFAFCAVAAASLVWLSPATIAYILLTLTVGVACFLFWNMSQSPLVSTAERVKVRGFLPIFLCSTVYWCLQAQIYGVLAVYSEQRLDREIFGFLIPAAWTQSLNPLFILVLSPLLAAVLMRFTARFPHRSSLASFGVIIAGAGLLLLLPFIGGGPASTPFLILAATIFLMTVGELFIGPVGMSAAGAHAPQAFATRFSALYFLTMAIGSSLAGSLSTFYDPSSPSREAVYLIVVSAVPIALGSIILVSKHLHDKNQHP
ncbi:oligopeptide:H+ symporter [Corynebacteriaceae bacterium 6-324]